MAKDGVAIVRPFGVLGAEYQVDAKGLFQYRLGWAIFAVFFVFNLAAIFFELSATVRYAAAAAAFIPSLVLMLNVARNGSRLWGNYPPNRPTSSP